MAVNAYEEKILLTDKEIRAHKEAMARIDADRIVQVEQVKARLKADRREFLLKVFGIVAVFGVILTIALAIYGATTQDRAKELKKHQLNQQTAEACIRADNIWLNGDCIPAKKN